MVLINRQFEPGDAKELIRGLINHKINFHKLKKYRLTIKEDRADPESDTRIAALNEALVSLNEMVDKAQKDGLDMVVESSIHVKLVPSESKVRMATS